MKYSAGLASTSFWFIESKKIAELILEGYSKNEILEMALKENIFQVERETRIKQIVNGVYRRLNSFYKCRCEFCKSFCIDFHIEK